MIKNISKAEVWKNLILFIVSYFFIVGIFQFIAILLLGIDPLEDIAKMTIQQDVILSFSSLVSTLIVVYTCVKYLEGDPFSKIDLSLKNRIKDIGLGIVVGLLIIGIGFLTLLLLNQITFEKIEFSAEKLILSIILFIMVALSEEIAFRGFILRNLSNSYSSKKALLISAVIFAVFHAFNPNMSGIAYINLFLGGVFLGLPYILTKNLWFSIALHYSWNFFQAFFGFNVSGQNSFSVINIGIAQNNILNGGEFGFEGSIFCVVALLIVIPLINSQIKT